MLYRKEDKLMWSHHHLLPGFSWNLKCSKFLQILHKPNEFGVWLQRTPKASALQWMTTNLKASHLRPSGLPYFPHGEEQKIRTAADTREISTLCRVRILKLTLKKESVSRKSSSCKSSAHSPSIYFLYNVGPSIVEKTPGCSSSWHRRRVWAHRGKARGAELILAWERWENSHWSKTD